MKRHSREGLKLSDLELIAERGAGNHVGMHAGMHEQKLVYLRVQEHRIVEPLVLV